MQSSLLPQTQQSPLITVPHSPPQRQSQHESTPGSATGTHDIMASSSLIQTSRSAVLRAYGQSQLEEDLRAIPSPAPDPGTVMTTEFQQTSYTWPSPYVNSPDALHGAPEGATDAAYTGLQEACLIRHFVENLAHSVSRASDVCFYFISLSTFHIVTTYFSSGSCFTPHQHR